MRIREHLVKNNTLDERLFCVCDLYQLFIYVTPQTSFIDVKTSLRQTPVKHVIILKFRTVETWNLLYVTRILDTTMFYMGPLFKSKYLYCHKKRMIYGRIADNEGTFVRAGSTSKL